ncbi:hypothetical protein A2303_04815 [Candidatus Falkowbacteria bacterium RIFOXYB2_FULL_47_14]|uniref:Methyltransferase FkbM domain-containing protein n=1 Tax=Candidatus Falkowbacteria bacterium RIFOXYA2_FULL_47_19 TaxID=1797994 RepID=A0A1F5SHF6_9BACT|nr:MAG: hypothetical protein A2227_02650 [Candidatus Falkowbacteria bacterium RIFOXYA2_FULL_47_19]OGF35824.1 MAG: hypothetical protein A2468_03835 [Candidatus Falkowbacteria bacterium RIFOXYC2_FULL_46_15]OGF42697.1 MAG: hypothetical protein A2303_04815 [Candidatus Falkowbacteria bacterium RIFOXYB2_FULL_47_14]
MINEFKKTIPRFVKNFYTGSLKSYKKISYSQCGEDLIMFSLVKKFPKDSLLYIDVGAHHPKRFSNTALFYKNGWRGINVEPDKNNFKLFGKRKRDINLNLGVYTKEGIMPYFRLNESTLNTFSENEAREYEKKHNFKIIAIDEIPIATLNSVINKYNNGIFPPFLNIDTEGTELEILQTIDYVKNFPKIICAETMGYGGYRSTNENKELINFLLGVGYLIYGQTGLNSIFTHKKWINY